MKKHDNIAKHRFSLPIYKCRKEIVNLIAKNQAVIIIGETGCGKSTQVPQFLVDSDEFKGCSIAITQPRRVSACSLARRVSYERHCRIGREVGYNVRFDNQSSSKTQIKYLTDGMLLREILMDRELSAYKVVILDEIHERTVQTDLLIGLLRELQSRRDLKLVLMSATLHCQLFIDFFDQPPIIQVSGRMFPVSIFYTEQPESDYVEACSISIIQLNMDLDMPGDFLVFMTGQEEIDELGNLLRSKQTDPPLHVLPLYAALPMHLQQKVFEDAPEGHRKVILSTNIAETSVTIPGIKYVIDSGLVKIKTFNPVSGVECLGLSPIAKAQAMQRSGRAGRESAGACFRLYTEDSFFELQDSPIAEIRRADLSSVVLQLFALGIQNPLKFNFLEQPPTKMLQSSLETIYSLGALDDNGALTEDGKIMATFPLTPKMTKVLLLASREHCGSQAITLLAMLSCENLFVVPSEKRKEANRQHRLFVDASGDHMTLVKVYEAFIKAKEPEKFCRKNFFSQRALEYAVNVRQQLVDVAKEMNVALEEDEDDEDDERKNNKLRKCIADALHENVAKSIDSGCYQCIEDGTKIWIHPSSFAFKQNYSYIVFSERVLTKKLYSRWVSEADPALLEGM
ncbi:helicase [Tritrichomonas foetus]|uniref:RNA helicase n=1 Tax=Tritrichomonas foetus TaxID=1144522 RepID=A0A1J4JCG7_9EUKA|nr:helicase [Tritrichomonas foetus]|eukprot:OHS95347.1 helicase [Tritrichomonas foetus]